MNLINVTMTESPCFKKPVIIEPVGAFLHSVGCPQPNAKNFINAENKSSAKAGVHAFIDANENVHVTLPINLTNKTAIKNWHAGSGPKGSSNAKYIGIEMTEPASIKYTGGANFIDLHPEVTKAHVLATYKTAVEYFAYLCIGFGWNALDPNVIMSHAEGHAKGIATAHSDVEHIWNKFGLTMNQFRQDVHNLMSGVNNATVQSTLVVAETTTPTVEVTPATPATNVNYTVEIDTDSLNIRSKASVNSDQVGSVKRGEVYTIVAESNGWGLLKSGAGWISLKYTKKNVPTPAPVVAPKPVDNTYKVMITVDSLRIRSKAVAGAVIGGAKRGEVYTIVQTSKNNWGQLKSGGWISLEFTKRV